MISTIAASRQLTIASSRPRSLPSCLFGQIRKGPKSSTKLHCNNNSQMNFSSRLLFGRNNCYSRNWRIQKEVNISSSISRVFTLPRYLGGSRRNLTTTTGKKTKKATESSEGVSSSSSSSSTTAASKTTTTFQQMLQNFLGPKPMPPRWTLAWYKEVTLICTVFAITGSSTMVLVRPAVSKGLGLNGSWKDGPWSFRICSLVIMTPVYATLLVAVGTIFGRHHYFRHFSVKMFSRFGVPPELMDKTFHETKKNFRKW